MKRKLKNNVLKIMAISILPLLLLVLASACSVERMLNESYLSNEKIESVPEIDIDDYEISSIESKDEIMEKSYKVELELIPKEENLDNPFMSYFTTGQEEEDEEVIENTLMLKKIYSIDGVKYADIELNEYLYKLAVGDIFNKIYQLQVINDSSVVLLKGDSLITLFLNEMYYD